MPNTIPPTASFKYDPATNTVGADVTMPDKYDDGLPITNLAFLDISYIWEGRTIVGTSVGITADHVSGGEDESWSVSMPVQDGQKIDVEMWANARTSNGGKSPDSDHVLIPIDRSVQVPKVPMPPVFK